MYEFIEINVNLDNNSVGLANYKDFYNETKLVYDFFYDELGKDIMSKIPIYVDNGTEHAGPVPISVPVLRKVVFIKLGIKSEHDSAEIVFQFAHELMHVVFWSVYGWERPFPNEEEEAICTAASLVSIKEFHPDKFLQYSDIVANQREDGYRRGVLVAEENKYNLKSLYEKMKI